MSSRVAIVGGTPTWRRGMDVVLADDGFTSVEFDSLADWRPGRGGSAILTWAADPSALGDIAGFLTEFPLIPVIAVIPGLDVGALAAAVRAGAAGVVDDSDPVEVFGESIRAAARGRVSVPHHLLTAMATRVPPTPDASSWISKDEGSWLRELAAGVTVAGLAEQIGYSERETFRMLGDLYEKIGVRNRTESIIWATRHGVLDAALD